jgi:hypothetical protein
VGEFRNLGKQIAANESGRFRYANERPVELRDMLNQSKDKKGLNQKRDNDLTKIKCSRCQELGHH